MKKLCIACILSGILTVFIAACGGGSGSNSSSGSSDVHMNANNFVQTAVTISKGSSITLIDDTSVIHIIANGAWDNGTPKPATESGAPVVSNLQFNGNDSHPIGPFNTSGTFHYYCSVHPGMNLTVTVQ